MTTTDTDDACRPRTWTEARSRLGNAVQKHGKDSSQAAEARVEFRALKLEDHVRKVIAEAPPISDKQRQRIAAILLSGGAA
jgi:hypothetical protein